jgi:hypothetical protein
LIVALLVRPLTVAVGLLGIGWGGVCFPVFWQSAALETMASRILGDSYQAATLKELLPTIESIEGSKYCLPTAIRIAAIVRLRLFDEAVDAGERQLLDDYMSSSESSIRLALRCVPSDSFLWLALYRVVSLRNGFASNYLNYLWMSYRLGPNEGWVALKRNGNAFSVYDLLPLIFVRRRSRNSSDWSKPGSNGRRSTFWKGPPGTSEIFFSLA